MDLTSLAYLLFLPASALSVFAIFYSRHKNKRDIIYFKQLIDRISEVKEGAREIRQSITEIKRKQAGQPSLKQFEAKLAEATAEMLYAKNKAVRVKARG